VKLKRIKEFYSAKVNPDLSFLERNQASVEDGGELQEGDLFCESPCSDLSHYVNRIEHRALIIGQRNRDSLQYPTDFLGFSNGDDDESPQDVDHQFSFDLSLASFSKEKSSKKAKKGFLRLGTLDSVTSPIQSGQSPKEFFPKKTPNIKKTSSTQLQFVEETETRLGIKLPKYRTTTNLVQSNSKSKSPDFLDIKDLKKKTQNDSKKNIKKEYKDFENIFSDEGWPKVKTRKRVSEMRAPQISSKKFIESRKSAQMFRRQKPNNDSVDLLFTEVKHEGLLPEFDNRPSVVKKDKRSKDSFDFLF
jgi:hypothetical protein